MTRKRAPALRSRYARAALDRRVRRRRAQPPARHRQHRLASSRATSPRWPGRGCAPTWRTPAAIRGGRSGGDGDGAAVRSADPVRARACAPAGADRRDRDRERSLDGVHPRSPGTQRRGRLVSIDLPLSRRGTAPSRRRGRQPSAPTMSLRSRRARSPVGWSGAARSVGAAAGPRGGAAPGGAGRARIGRRVLPRQPAHPRAHAVRDADRVAAARAGRRARGRRHLPDHDAFPAFARGRRRG